MGSMYVIFTMDTFARKSNIAVVENEDDAKQSVVGLLKNGLIAGYDKVEIWNRVDVIVNDY
ncbi:hypothetical protein CUC43_11400 [Bacillus thuringiensis LM1212]|uniref:hypothetical protein n=1 Tax=Bacillus cereus group TaxID=86661 RepID=UPI00041E8E7A|nr:MULTISPECIES: hypothetical protein [Bacillus cereus group]AXY07425.1 hypothetical protein CUC43_11400 [Bacillus thuringiensis LM1212]QDF25807.1 hypothetical protein FJR70_23770 [Bacillus tropicus]QUG93747.1 hypothetical protein HCM98_01715 [Bacillus tropicus]